MAFPSEPSSACRRVAGLIAQTLSAGAWTSDMVHRQLVELVGSEQKWMRPAADRLLLKLGANRPAVAQIQNALLSDEDYRRAYQANKTVRAIEQASPPNAMFPAPGPPSTWRVPSLLTPMEVAAWLAMRPNRLFWLADRQAEFRSSEKARHYRCRWSRKRTGGYRLIEVPKTELRQVQRDIAGGILARIPAHHAAHGFRRGRNIRSFCERHTNKRIVLRMDLKHFFTTVTRNRVAAVFRTAGYPHAVVSLLSDLVTTRTPTHVLNTCPETRLSSTIDKYAISHLPQGAPSSPALANLCAYRLDCRLAGLARRFDADYTRYADDLLFSGGAEFAKDTARFHVFALAIILDEGFEIHPRKTRMMRRATRQAAAGLILNDTVNTKRGDYDQLRAILHNCARQGVESQNRSGHENFRLHLLGRINFHAQINPARGAKLQAAFDRAFGPAE